MLNRIGSSAPLFRPQSASLLGAAALALLTSPLAFSQCAPTWIQRVVTGPSAREDARMVYDPVSEKVILFGGANYTSGLRYNDTWEWNGAAWTQRFPTGTLPPARSGQGMTYDSSRSRIVMFGGNLPNNATNYADTWEYNGSTWTNVANGTPFKRYAPGLAFDSTRDVVMLVAGQTDLGQPFREAWAWDGSTWLRESTTGPVNGYAVSFDYDPIRKVGLFFGGTTYFDNLPRYNDTWTWNGTTWTQLNPAAKPPGRRFAPMVFDPARECMVLFGGDGANNVFLNDTWLWNGTNWTQLAASGPSARRTAAMAYDEARGEIVLFGGFDTALRGDTWVLPSPLGFIRHPLSTGVCAGGQVSFTVKAAAATSYHWRHNTVPMDTLINPSAATPMLMISSAQGIDEGSYDCVITNSCTNKTSHSATFTLCRADLNCDTLVDDSDFTEFVVAYNILDCADPSMPPECTSDFNSDGVVDDSDFVVFVQAYNALLCG